MISREELKEIAKIRGNDAYFVSLYLNVNPVTNVKDNYVIHVKNMLKQNVEKLDKVIMKSISRDFEKIESYILTNKKVFKKGLAIISCDKKNFWKEFHLSIPVRNDIIIDTTPYIKPLLDILDNYQRYAILLVGREYARLFMIHLGEIEEYIEIYTEGVPGRHKKGGWFSLSEKTYERHIDYHVERHLKDVLKQLDTIMSKEYVGRLIIGGSEDAVSRVRTMLPHTISEKIIGTFHADMNATGKEILEKTEPIFRAYENMKESETIEEILTKAMKNENAVIGIEDVMNAIQEGRVMKLVLLKDFSIEGLLCKNCGHLTIQNITSCPYCKGEVEKANYVTDLIAQRAIEQGAFVDIVYDNPKLKETGGIGAILRF